MLGQENISVWVAGLFVRGNTVLLELPEILELDEIPSLIPALPLGDCEAQGRFGDLW